MSHDDLLLQQRRFYTDSKAGCLFAALAAYDPMKYGWEHVVVPPRAGDVDHELQTAIASPTTTTLSLLFPDVRTDVQLVELITVLKQCKLIVLDQTETFLGSTCLGFRTLVGDKRSFITGFGDFPFLPPTRRAPCVELITRVKPRPDYTYVFKEAAPDVIHLADLDMKDMPKASMQALWDASFAQTKKILGSAPDLRSAARTTYAIPTVLLEQHP